MSAIGAPRLPAGFEIAFFDDFDSASLDRSKWNVAITGKTTNQEQQAYVDSPEVICICPGRRADRAADGVLFIQPRYSPGFVTREGKNFDFISGRLDSRDKAGFIYGTLAARMKLSPGPGLWPAFWALSPGHWPENGEIDIMESVGEPDWTSTALHGPGYYGETALVNRFYFPQKKDAAAWHVYSVDWTSTDLTFRIDGSVAFRVTRPMVEFYGPWAFDREKYLILNFALGGSYPQKINRVRAPYTGLPDATIELVKDGRARLLVDWIGVWQEKNIDHHPRAIRERSGSLP